ncbi:MAG: SDR family oxidoreductase [Pseudomonadota bacterium]
MTAENPLAGRIALVTGATRGIGRAIALKLAKDGAVVALTGRNEDQGAAVVREIETAGGRAFFSRLDVRDFAATQGVIAEIVGRLGRLDILVANAGIGMIGPVESADPEEWRAMMEVNYLGTAHSVKAALEPMLAQGRGDIVAIASSAGVTGYPDWSGYCASKWAVMGFMDCLGREMVSRGIRVSTVCPGSVDTPFWDILNVDLHPAGSDSRKGMVTADDVAEVVRLQLRLPPGVLLKNTLMFPTNEWH